MERSRPFDLDMMFMNAPRVIMSPPVTFSLDRYNSHDELQGFITRYQSNRHPITMQHVPLLLSEHQRSRLTPKIERSTSHHLMYID